MTSEITSQCDELQPWLAAYALGEAEATPEQQEHLARCAGCQHDLREYRAVASLLPYAAAEQEPAPALRARLLEAVNQAIPPAPPAPAVARARRRWPSVSRAAWAAYAFAALAIALLGWNITLRSQLADQSAQIAFHRQSWQTMIGLLNDSTLHWYSVAGDQARGHVWLTEQADVACLVAQQLPPLPEDRAYQVWLVRQGQPVSGGTFVPRDGNGWVLVQPGGPLSNYQALFVTVEDARGSPAPTGPRVLSGSLATGATPAVDRSELQNLLRTTFDS